MPFPKRDCRLMIAELAVTRERVRELIRTREIVSSHKLEQIRRVQILEKQDVFDRIKIIAKMHEQALRRLHAGFDLEALYTGLYNPRWLPPSEEFTLKINVEIERLRLEILISEPPPPPQYDLSPRQSPTASTG